MKRLALILLCLLSFFLFKKRFFDNTDYKAILIGGGIIIDVKSEAEFYSGHIENSLNIYLGELSSRLDCLKYKDQAIITCCTSGIRSEGLQKSLSSKGYTNLVNGGGWLNLERKLK